MATTRKTAAEKKSEVTVSEASPTQSYPVGPAQEPAKEPERDAGLDARVIVTFDGPPNRRVVHTLSGKVFESGDEHELSLEEALDLQSRSGLPFSVRAVS